MNVVYPFIAFVFTTAFFGQSKQEQLERPFLPKGVVVMERIYGDLNNDGTEDCILLLKGIDPNQILVDEVRGTLDRNRRGILILFKKNDRYELALRNSTCFSSENEDGGVYFAPELALAIQNGNLYVHYGHGRYGHWRYTFRYQNSDFDLIGYDESYSSQIDSDFVVFDQLSVNFLTKKKVTKKVTHVAANGQEAYNELEQKITATKRVKLSEMTDFDAVDRSAY